VGEGEKRSEEKGSEEETTAVRTGHTEHVVEEVQPAAPYIDPGPSWGDPNAPVVTEDDRVRVGPYGQVEHERERIERRPIRGPFDDFWPALAILLLAALIGLGAWWYFTRTEEKPVPSVTSMALDPAITRVQNEGFKVDIVNLSHRTPRGTVFDQRPAAGAELEEGSPVTLLVSKGPATVVVPNAVGLTEQEARDRFAQAGLQVRVFEVFSDEPEGDVVAQDPGSGERVSKDESVRLNISKGSGLVDVPSLVGETRASAEAQLSEVGLKANVFEVPNIEPAGTVVAQNPLGGKLREGEAVRLNVSTGTPP
jgi:eukaryotic-like serine/threonine-protein kinase